MNNIRQNLFGQGAKGGKEPAGYGRPPPRPQREETPSQNSVSEVGAGSNINSRGNYEDSSQNVMPQRPAAGRTPASPLRGTQLRIAKVEDKTLQNQYIFGNLCAVSPQNFPPTPDGTDMYLLLNQKFVVTVRPLQGFPSGCISLSDPQRTWCDVGMMDPIMAEPYSPFSSGPCTYLGSLDVEVGFASSKKLTEAPFDQDVLAEAFIKQFENQIFAPSQRLLMDYKNIPLIFMVKTVQLVDLSMEKSSESAPTVSTWSSRGILTRQTPITFYKDSKSPIKLKGSSKRPAANSIIAPDFKFEDMGIGGLDTEFGAIFRRAFASRIFPPGLIEKLGIQHVKGILLYGPPGTGKTLIARQIGKMLNSREPKVINGPEVLNKYVGQSEENIRKMFADAEKEYKEKGDESGLHIIIFDELDAVCKQRGSGNGGGTGVGDSVVNQLLSKLDGVDQLNNILLIGMTNRKDMIDDALLRPGRLEVHMEISLPDEHGRAQILKIHTSKMRDNNVMDTDVNVQELAHLTKNFSGAEIGGLVKSASSFAFNRHVKVGTVAGVSDDIENMKVNRGDFMKALDEVKPAFGVSEEELESAMGAGILHYSPYIENILKDGRLFTDLVKNSSTTSVLSVLLHGPPGSGKTALAARIAKESGFPFIKLITAENMVGFGEMAKIQYLNKVFTDAYKSPQNIVVIDNIERIIEWVPIGPRFLNPVLQALMVLLTKQPPAPRRLLILGTTSQRSVMRQLDLQQIFNRELAVPNVNTHAELSSVLREMQAFPQESDLTESLNTLRDITGTDHVGLGIKKVLLAVGEARQEVGNMAGRFAEVISQQISASLD
ncbi:BgTH12-03021 [Blumeria graminis f. sp. triticale]|uniref:Vesicular-fusion protein SEC18 n=3 Tax=Blumeria graminis TaxID=34373 RepID=A0A9X9MJA8_BLUGR|nr:ATPase [Blumeria graminis f. sp. tritici 96224]CAD6503355.1 BgTH12-03021 [Blumeria graminis f. sp. triticale]VDB89395.1 Bgt-5290 [Blumeria graminis f. sp. tritici]